jgi:hypothetical protein
MSSASNLQLLRLTGLLHLQQRAREAEPRALEFLIVNDTASVIPCQQAALLTPRGRIVLSGVAAPDDSAPYRVWAAGVLKHLAAKPEPRSVTQADLPRRLAADWEEFFPAHAIWCPLGAGAGLLLGRPDPFSDGDAQVLALLAGAYTQSLALSGRRRGPGLLARLRPRAITLWAVALLAIGFAGTIPVRQSTIAPAEIVPADPAPVRAPVEGVIDAVLVAPNAVVAAGTPLVSLDRIALQTRAEVAEKTLEMARAEYQVASQQALNDPRAKARLSLLSAKMEQQSAELALARDTLARAVLTAPRAGIAVFDGAVDWIGKPVALGERIMLIATPSDSLLEIQVPAGDFVGFTEGSEIQFFSNLAPDKPIAGTITFASYATTLTQDGIAAYVFRAKLTQPERLGLKGSAKLYGPPKPLALWLLRKPIASVRQWLAL